MALSRRSAILLCCPRKEARILHDQAHLTRRTVSGYVLIPIALLTFRCECWRVNVARLFDNLSRMLSRRLRRLELCVNA
jgi:hypothetical protein